MGAAAASRVNGGRVIGVTGVGGILGGIPRPFLESQGTKSGVDRTTPRSQGAPGIPPSVFEAHPSTIDRTCDISEMSSCAGISKAAPMLFI